MRTTIDSAGRIVVPKAIRESLGLSAGQRLDIAEVDGRIEIDVPAPVVKLVDRGRGLVAAPPTGVEMPVLSAADVRRVLDAVRR